MLPQRHQILRFVEAVMLITQTLDQNQNLHNSEYVVGCEYT